MELAREEVWAPKQGCNSVVIVCIVVCRRVCFTSCLLTYFLPRSGRSLSVALVSQHKPGSDETVIEIEGRRCGAGELRRGRRAVSVEINLSSFCPSKCLFPL